MMNVPEFMDTYSDDLLYLMEFRKAHISFPGTRPMAFLHEQCFARLFCAFMIGNLESMMEYWKEKDSQGILAPYFESGSNEARIAALHQSFVSKGIAADEEVLKQFLAIKYLRNVIIHSRWKSSERDYVSEMGFPTDTRQLNESHLEKMYIVNNKMMLYIAAVEIPGIEKWSSVNSLPKINRIFDKNDLATYLWINLERRYELIPPETYSDKIVNDVLFDWNLFKDIRVQELISLSNIDRDINILEPFVVNKQYSDVPIGYLNLDQVNTLQGEELDKLLSALSKILKQPKESIFSFLEALANAKNCYELMGNNTVSNLLTRLANFKGDVAGLDISAEATLAEKLFTLGRLYYHYAENS